ncbi:hypothetical protein ILYODFUR_027290 [Ilyodon furcidens]|uniref:Uncharacterized protein n=1 Tax=Ilyodon furcidens TaxID=33524 RepID=A0ABV0UVK2_9TELE
MPWRSTKEPSYQSFDARVFCPCVPVRCGRVHLSGTWITYLLFDLGSPSFLAVWFGFPGPPGLRDSQPPL